MCRWLVLLALASCIRAQLVPCGDRLCADGQRCIAGNVCAAPEQLTACEGLPDETLCVTSRGNGACSNGLCVIGRCGDGQVTLGEACDDGNLISGDGCREDCRSDETCGNGVLDVGESCDCGTADKLGIACTMPNSDDPTALCDLACTRRCGDGVVTGSEQCDGTTVPATCADFGFYSGTMACTGYCALDTSACSGECGDGIVHAEQGEICDKSIPPDSCVTYGRDYGLLGCSTSCGPDLVNTCGYLTGWSMVTSTSLSDLSRIGINARGALVLRPGPPGHGAAVVRWRNAETSRPNPGWTKAAANSRLLFAIGPDGYAWYDGAWHERTAALGTVVPALTPSDQAYLVTPTCTVTRLDIASGAVATIPSPPATTCATPVTLDEELYVAAGASGILVFNGTQWSTHSAGVATSIWRSGDRQITRVTNGMIEDRDGMLAVAEVSDPDDQHVVVSFEGISYAHELERIDALGQTYDGAIFSIGKGIYRFDPGILSLTPQMPDVTVRQIQALGTEVALCGSIIGWLGNPRARPFAGTCSDLHGPPWGEHWIVGIENGLSAIYHWDGATSAYVHEIAGTSLAGTATDVFAISGGDLRRRVNGAWLSVTPPGCAALAVADNRSEVYAIASCSNTRHLLRWNGSSFDFVPAAQVPASDRLIVGREDGAVFVGSSILDAGTFVYVGVSFVDVVAVNATDVFGRPPLVSDGLLHLIGGRKTEIRAPSGPLDVTQRIIYIWDDRLHQLVAIPRARTRLPSSGL